MSDRLRATLWTERRLPKHRHARTSFKKNTAPTTPRWHTRLAVVEPATLPPPETLKTVDVVATRTALVAEEVSQV